MANSDHAVAFGMHPCTHHRAFAQKEGIWCKRGHPCTSPPLTHSCNTAAACRLISRFHREEAAYCFEQAAAADPNAALPHWGIAIAHGPDCAWHTPFSHCRHTRLLCRSSLLLWKCIAPRMLDRAPPFVVKQHRFSIAQFCVSHVLLLRTA